MLYSNAVLCSGSRKARFISSRYVDETRLGSEALVASRSTNGLFIAIVPHGHLSELWSGDCLDRFSQRGTLPGSHAAWVQGFICLEFLQPLRSRLFTSRRHLVLSLVLLLLLVGYADTLMLCLVCITDIKFLLSLAYC